MKPFFSRNTRKLCLGFFFSPPRINEGKLNIMEEERVSQHEN